MCECHTTGGPPARYEDDFFPRSGRASGYLFLTYCGTLSCRVWFSALRNRVKHSCSVLCSANVCTVLCAHSSTGVPDNVWRLVSGERGSRSLCVWDFWWFLSTLLACVVASVLLPS